MLPVFFFMLSLALSAYFYRLLPAEAAYHFKLDGTPDRWLGRGAAVALVLMAQLFFTFMAAALVLIIIKISAFFRQTVNPSIKSERILQLMGNMLALPQLLILFAMLDIFRYNSYRTHIMSMWVFLLIILGLATIALVLLLVSIFQKAKQQQTSPPKTKER